MCLNVTIPYVLETILECFECKVILDRPRTQSNFCAFNFHMEIIF